MTDYKLDILDSLSSDKHYPSLADRIKGKNVVVYGAGEGWTTFRLFVLEPYRLMDSINALLDIKFDINQPRIRDGIPSYHPLGYNISINDAKNTVAIITTGKQQYYNAMIKDLSHLGITDIIFSQNTIEFATYYTSLQVKQDWKQYYNNHKNEILSTLDLLSDDTSRNTYSCFIRSFIENTIFKIPAISDTEQYFPKDINMKKGCSRFVDCGSHRGETIARLNSFYGKAKHIVCFEPDEENFKILSDYLTKADGLLADSITAFPCGVYSTEKRLTFDGGVSCNSAISELGNTTIQCVSIDNVLRGFNPTRIKMDIESAEVEALKGAEKTIKTYKPDLSICVYHLPNHAWEIPLYLHNLNLGYRFYMRSYSESIMETVLYATTD